MRGKDRSIRCIGASLTGLLLIVIRIALACASICILESISTVAGAIHLDCVCCTWCCILRSYFCFSRSPIGRLLSLYLNLLCTFLSIVLLYLGSFVTFTCGVWRIVVFSSVGVIMGIMENDVWWETLDDPLVLQTLIWSESFVWIPFKASTDEVDKRLIRHVP